MKNLKIIVLPLSMIFIYISCDNAVEPQIPNDIKSFVHNLNLDAQQEVEIILEVKNEDVYVFAVPYGPPKDCPSGCFYSRFYGLKNKTKVNSFEYYDIDSNDTYLFSQDFFRMVRYNIEYIYYSLFLPLLAADKDTQLSTLRAIAEILADYVSTLIGYKLIENPAVQNDFDALTLLSNLPVFQGDPYKEIRDIADSLLGN